MLFNSDQILTFLTNAEDAQAEDQAVRLLHKTAEECKAEANRILGVACTRCNGTGVLMYSNAATWRLGWGAVRPTKDVCCACWGTGRSDESGPDLHEFARLRAAAVRSKTWTD